MSQQFDDRTCSRTALRTIAGAGQNRSCAPPDKKRGRPALTAPLAPSAKPTSSQPAKRPAQRRPPADENAPPAGLGQSQPPHPLSDGTTTSPQLDLPSDSAGAERPRSPGVDAAALEQAWRGGLEVAGLVLPGPAPAAPARRAAPAEAAPSPRSTSRAPLTAGQPARKRKSGEISTCEFFDFLRGDVGGGKVESTRKRRALERRRNTGDGTALESMYESMNWAMDPN